MATVTEYIATRMTPDQAATLEALAALLGVNRSEAIRRVLDSPLSSLAILTMSTDANKKTADQLVAGRAAARLTTDMAVSGVNSNRNT